MDSSDEEAESHIEDALIYYIQPMPTTNFLVARQEENFIGTISRLVTPIARAVDFDEEVLLGDQGIEYEYRGQQDQTQDELPNMRYNAYVKLGTSGMKIGQKDHALMMQGFPPTMDFPPSKIDPSISAANMAYRQHNDNFRKFIHDLTMEAI